MHYKFWIISALCLSNCNWHQKKNYSDYACSNDLKIVHNVKVDREVRNYMNRNKASKRGLYFIEIINHQNQYSLTISSMMSMDEYKGLNPNKFEIINDELVLLKLKGCDNVNINEDYVRKYLPGFEKKWIRVRPNGDTLVYRNVILYNPEVMKFIINKDNL